MAKYQILICALLVASVSAGLFSKKKDTDTGAVKEKSGGLFSKKKDSGSSLGGLFSKKKDGGDSPTSGSIKDKAKSLFHIGSNSDDEDEFEEEELKPAEEELSRIKSTIDGETMRKMADVNNHDIPILSLDDQAAIVDKGVDFSKPFDVSKVTTALAAVIKEKLPPGAPPMTTEDLMNMKETMAKPADPAAAKKIQAEKKEAFKATHGSSGASSNKPATGSPMADKQGSSPSRGPSGPGSSIANQRGSSPPRGASGPDSPMANQRGSSFSRPSTQGSSIANQRGSSPPRGPSSPPNNFPNAIEADSPYPETSGSTLNAPEDTEQESSYSADPSGSVMTSPEGTEQDSTYPGEPSSSTLNAPEDTKQESSYSADPSGSDMSSSTAAQQESASAAEPSNPPMNYLAASKQETSSSGQPSRPAPMNFLSAAKQQPSPIGQQFRPQPMSYLKAAKPDASPSGPSSPSEKGTSFLEKAKVYAEDGAKKVGYHADEFIENFKAGDTSDSDDNRPAANTRSRRRPKVRME